MMLSNSVKISVVVAMLVSCGAFAQEQAGAPVAIIESDDMETIELFLAWSSIRASVRRSFQEQGMEMPEGLEDWLAENRGRMKFEEHGIVVRHEEAGRSVAQNFIDELFHVFRESVFRQQSLKRLNQLIMEVQKQISENRNALREGMVEWRSPAKIAQEYLRVKEKLYELDLNSAQTRARLRTLHGRVELRAEELKTLAEAQAAVVGLKIQAIQEQLETAQAAIERQEAESVNNPVNGEDISRVKQHLLEQKIALAGQMAALESLRLGQGDETIRNLKNALVDSESELAVGLATRELVEDRLAELKQKLHLAGEQTQHENELASHQGRLLEMKRQLEQGGALPLIPIKGLPKLRLRWVN